MEELIESKKRNKTKKKKKKAGKSMSMSKSMVVNSSSGRSNRKKIKKTKSLTESDMDQSLLVPGKKKMRRGPSKQLLKGTLSSKSRNKSKLDDVKKGIRHYMGNWVGGLRDTKAPPRPKKKKSKAKPKKKYKSKKKTKKKKGEGIVRKKFLKRKRGKSKKKKPISKSRSKAKGKSKGRSKTAKKKTRKTGKGKSKGKSKTPKKRKKKVVKKRGKSRLRLKSKAKRPAEMSDEGEYGINRSVQIQRGLLDTGNQETHGNSLDQIYTQNNQKFLAPMTNLLMQVGGGIDRENEKDKEGIAMHHLGLPLQEDNYQYHTNDKSVKMQFGEEDQIIEHLFTMHWSQVDRVLLRAKVEGFLAPPSKRMTILEIGSDVYSNLRTLVGGQNNEVQASLENNVEVNNQTQHEEVNEEFQFGGINRVETNSNAVNHIPETSNIDNQESNQVVTRLNQGEATENVLPSKPSFQEENKNKMLPSNQIIRLGPDNSMPIAMEDSRKESKVENSPKIISEEVVYLQNQPLNKGLLNQFVKGSSDQYQKKMVNGRLTLTTGNNPSINRPVKDQPISFNNNMIRNMENQERDDLTNGLVLKPSYQQRRGFPLRYGTQEEPHRNHMVRSNLMRGARERADSQSSNQFNGWGREVSRPMSVRSTRSRGMDTLNRQAMLGGRRPVHMYTRFQPSFSKHEHDMIRSQYSNSRSGVASVDRNLPQKRMFPMQRGNQVYQSEQGMQNIYSFSNLKKNQGGQNPAPIHDSLDQLPSPHKFKVYRTEPNLTGKQHHYSQGNNFIQDRVNYNGQVKSNGLCNVLAMFFRKILVFNSKLESIKQKLNNGFSSFDSLKLFQSFSKEDPGKLTLRDFTMLFHYLGFNYPPSIVIKIMLYLSRNRFSINNAPMVDNSSLNTFELTGSGRLLEVESKKTTPIKFGNPRPVPQSEKDNFLDYTQFRGFFDLNKDTGTVLSEDTIERSLNKHKTGGSNKEAEYHLIRQLVILSLRKLEDLGWVIQSLRMFSPQDIFAVLGAESGNSNYHQDLTEETNTVKNNNTSNTTSITRTEILEKNFFPIGMKGPGPTFQKIPGNSKSRERNQIQKQKAAFKLDKLSLGKFLRDMKNPSQELTGKGLLRFLEQNGVDFIPTDLVHIFKELGSQENHLCFGEFVDYLSS